jgi:hypothetical protein
MVNLEQLLAAAMCSTPSGRRKAGVRTSPTYRPRGKTVAFRLLETLKEATFSGKSVQLSKLLSRMKFVDLP